MERKKKTIVLLDGNALIHRAYHALPPLTTKKGELVNAVYGFTTTLLSVLEKFKPEYIAASFDLAGPTFRHEQYEDYKATRVKAPDDLYAQIPRVKEIVQAFNIPIYEKEGFEADDCVGALARQASKEGAEVIIVTGDNDVLQLVDDSVKVFTMRKGIKDTVLYDEALVEEKYGFKPEQIPDYKGLAGDSSDNIPGVRGIGPKTASDLLKKYVTLEGIYSHIDEIKSNVQAKLIQDKEQVFLSRELGRIDTAAPVTLRLPDALAHDFDRAKLTALLQEMEFWSLVKRLPGGEGALPATKKKEAKKKAQQKRAKTLAEPEAIRTFLSANEGKLAAVFVTAETGSLFGHRPSGIDVAFSERGSTTLEWNEKTKPAIKAFLEDEKIAKTVYDEKTLLHMLAPEETGLAGISSDIMIAAYLLNSGGNVELPYLALSELGEEEIAFPAVTLFRLHEQFEKKLRDVSKTQKKGRTLEDVFRNIEMPLIPILYGMEKEGIYLNTEKFRALSEELGKELETLEKDIYKFAGKEFNINSPKQLSEILFTDLKIPTTNIKRTKTGISTASSELAKLQEYPIIQKIESYRELFKLKTTYLDALPLLVDKDSRLHTTFQQAVAATGRLSSTEPNLQNIPARNSWSERIRSAFEAGKGKVLVGADYSQIELRIMAHMCGDKALVEAFHKGEDVHRTTAAVVFKVKPEEVTPDMRRKAKVFNFGLMYGMGSYGLSQAAEITPQEAAEFINAYFKKFSGVKKFMERLKEEAREKLFVETELGRRRYIPEIQSGNFQVVRSAERMAINMPIQGMEADIVKLGMIAVDALIKERFSESVRMVLQVHDELIFEAEEAVGEEFAKEVKRVMEEVYTLSVPLIAEVYTGKDWGEI
ncbi:MAG: DNA polymerase I [Candidatus Moranbacteria bacterium RIFCSPHIGHO2_01_FULL_55_24]|nr:MAG: DNA polymerase I [Candidatus Moranbacteria bacterium RIFCSPHIGHO2_01_FULL_55_24]